MAKKKRVNRTPQELLEDARHKSAVSRMEKAFPPLGLSSPIASELVNIPEKSVTKHLCAVEPLPDVPKITDTLLITVADLCSLLKISRSTLTRMEHNNLPPGRLKIGGAVRYDRKKVEEWISTLSP